MKPKLKYAVISFDNAGEITEINIVASRNAAEERKASHDTLGNLGLVNYTKTKIKIAFEV